MTTLPDGSRRSSNMYLWQPLAGSFYAPCVDGDYDAGVIGHEYTPHDREPHDRQGQRPQRLHAGDMGEAVGDLFAIEMLNEYGFVPTDGENRYATGHLRDRQQAARHPQLRRRTSRPRERSRRRARTPQVDPLNFSDIGYDMTGAGGPLRRRDLDRHQLRRPAGAGGEVQRAVPGVRPGAADALRRRRAAGRPVPGQPALDPARCSTRSCSIRRTRRWSTRATRCSRPT